MNDADYIYLLEARLGRKSIPIDTGEIGMDSSDYINFLTKLCEENGISTDFEESYPLQDALDLDGVPG
jgi:hypothetical protein